MSRPVFRLLTVAAVATAAVGLTALPALAHVTVSSPGATQGSFGVLTFRMPNEMDNANATGLKVQLPAEQPLASVAVKPEPGWTYTVTRAKLSQPITDDDGNQASAAAAPPAAASAGEASKGSVTGAYVVGGTGLVAGLVALALAATGRRRRATVDGSPQPASTSTSTSTSSTGAH